MAERTRERADLRTVIERAVVKTCFKRDLPHSGSGIGVLEESSGLSKPCAASAPRAKGAAGKITPQTVAERTASRAGLEFDFADALPGPSTIESVKRFISVLDRIYSKVLSDGEFDYIGFMRARSLGSSEMLDLLEACAVRLGEEWECDSLDFNIVTIATSRLQRILARLSQDNGCFSRHPRDCSVLLLVPYGETHLFAVNLIEERFRLKGWETSLTIAHPTVDVAHLVKASDFHLICIAWLDTTLKNRVDSVLQALHSSVNRDRTCVIAGGPAALEHSLWLEERGVEKVCSNAQIALETAERHGAARISAQNATGINGSLSEPSRSA